MPKAFAHREDPPEEYLSFYHFEYWDSDPLVRTDYDRLVKIMENPGIRTIAKSHKLSALPVSGIIDGLESRYGPGIVSIEYVYAENNPAHVAVTVPPELRLDPRVSKILYDCVQQTYEVP